MRARLYPRKDALPQTTYLLVVAICADYDRRATALRKNELAQDTANEFKHLNEAVDLALSCISDADERKHMMQDIAHRRGYNWSQLSPFVSKNIYYKRKRLVAYRIAQSLNLI